LDANFSQVWNTLTAVKISLIEVLECRRLFDAVPWSHAATLIGLDVLRDQQPQWDGLGQTVAILDTGIDYTHPALGNGFGQGHKVIGGYDFFDEDDNPMDTQGHGTQVAGAVAASVFEVNGRRHSGIAPGANLVALRITDRIDNLVPDARMITALTWISAHREEFNISAVNVSFGFGDFEKKLSDGVFASQLQSLRDAGVVVAASTGNGGIREEDGIQYPAADMNVIAVGATDGFDVITEYSQRSEATDILAPGEDFRSTSLSGRTVPVNGTSFASPLIAGAAAILKQINPLIAPADVLSVLRASGKDNKDGDDEFGQGTELRFPRLQIDNAVTLTQARFSPAAGIGEVGEHGSANDLVLDKQGVLHFVWYDSGTRNLQYASRSTTGLWSVKQIVDDSGEDVGGYLSLAIDSNGKPSVAYFNGTRGDLRFASLEGAEWITRTLDAKQSVGLYPSLQFDKNNDPQIAYYHKAKGDLRLARRQNDVWEIRDIDTNGDSGRSPSLAIQANGLFGVAYENSSTGRLKYAYQFNSNRWTTLTVDKTTGASFISLQFDKFSRPNISYYDATPANLKFARFKNQRWATDTITEDGAVGLYSQLSVEQSGEAVILFYDRNANALQLAVGTLGQWDLTTLQEPGGKFIKAKRMGGDRITYSYYDTIELQLKISRV